MGDKELYQQKMQAQLDELRAKLDILKARAAGASADAQLELNKQVAAMESRIEEGKMKLSQLAESSDEAWDTMKAGFESAWDSLKTAAGEAAAKFKDSDADRKP